MTMISNPNPFTTFSFIILLSSIALLASASVDDDHEDFLQCLPFHSLDNSISNLVYTSINPSYPSVLNFSIRNSRFSTEKTPKPSFIITPTHVSHIQAAVICSKNYGFEIRIRSGGHDYEGISYVSHVAFVVVDLINLRSVTIDTKTNTTWVQSGATLGELYYRIAEKSQTLAFPAGICPTVGVSGHFSGGGYGVLHRKYGLAADNVIDAQLVDANGEVHDRKSMGEDLFWAIRGGGGGSFGIVLSWKIKLVSVPPIVTVFSVSRTLEQNATNLVHQWQYVADKLDHNLFIGIILTGMSSTQGGEKTTATATFFSLFLGKANELLAIMKKTFPELGLVKEDCIETSWIKSTLMISRFNTNEADSLDDLLNRTPLNIGSSKIKSDYVKEPISKNGLQGMWEKLTSEEVQVGQAILIPYGGKMSEISDSEIPFSHRAGYRYEIDYIVGWEEQSTNDASERHIKWLREFYDYMTPFVSKSPRAAYVNCRDLDIGTNNNYGESTSYEQASIWGLKYFGNNFKRLVKIKTNVDSSNFFRHEQSILSLSQQSRNLQSKELDTFITCFTKREPMCESNMSFV